MARPRRHTASFVLHDRQGSVFEVTIGTGRMRAKRGTLEVRDGGLLWYPKRGKRGWRISWRDLDREDAPRWTSVARRAFDARGSVARSR